jgi:hypothetical protein
MPLDNEKVFVVSIPDTHELAARVPGRPGPDEEVFRTGAAILLKQTFGKDVFTLNEVNTNGQLSLKVAVRIRKTKEDERKEEVESLRQRFTGLGFSVADSDYSKR